MLGVLALQVFQTKSCRDTIDTIDFAHPSGMAHKQIRSGDHVKILKSFGQDTRFTSHKLMMLIRRGGTSRVGIRLIKKISYGSYTIVTTVYVSMHARSCVSIIVISTSVIIDSVKKLAHKREKSLPYIERSDTV